MPTRTKTPAAGANAADKSTNDLGAKTSQLKEITLPSGLKATVIAAKGKHVWEAQRLMNGDPDKMMPALITVCTMLDGKRITIEELDELPAGDCMTLISEFSGAFQ